MNSADDLNKRIKIFESFVISAFSFLENDYKMSHKPVRISNRNDPREITASIRYESESHNFDITWAIGQNGLGILIRNKACLDKYTVLKSNSYAYFESFIEYLTNGNDKPIVPQVYPKMSTKSLIEVMEIRKNLLETSFSETINKLAEKLKLYFMTLLSKNIDTFVEYHKWMSVHQ